MMFFWPPKAIFDWYVIDIILQYEYLFVSITVPPSRSPLTLNYPVFELLAGCEWQVLPCSARCVARSHRLWAGRRGDPLYLLARPVRPFRGAVVSPEETFQARKNGVGKASDMIVDKKSLPRWCWRVCVVEIDADELTSSISRAFFSPRRVEDSTSRRTACRWRQGGSGWCRKSNNLVWYHFYCGRGEEALGGGLSIESVDSRWIGIHGITEMCRTVTSWLTLRVNFQYLYTDSTVQYIDSTVQIEHWIGK